MALRPCSTSGISSSFPGLSRSSGWVTHVLLTRSRLCPRASPGSSLHLHVLSTPPAFVLSQDQTLREELLNVELSVHHTRGCSYTWSKPGCVDGVLLYCLISGCHRPRRAGGRSNLDAHFDLVPARMRAPIEVRMLLSFQRPPRLCSGGDSSV